jgi:hypothetical protein
MSPQVDFVLAKMRQYVQNNRKKKKTVQVDANLLAAVVQHLEYEKLHISTGSQNKTTNH